MWTTSARLDNGLCIGGEPPDGQLPGLVVHGPQDTQRAQVEAFIDRIYARRFGANPRTFAPVLVSRSDGDAIVAAAGYRAAEPGPLFLETYLEAPVESLLSLRIRRPLERREIVEVGHLAAGRAGEGQRLIHLLARHLAELGFKWVVGTLTRELRHLFLRVGVAPLALGTASAAALGPEAARWGRYYEHQPVVLAGNLPLALRQLARPARKRLSS